MADNVDISLKLGTEADLSSAINAGARAGAAFAAAAQSAVKGISLATAATSHAFSAVNGTRIGGNTDFSKEIRSLGITQGLISHLAVNAVKSSYANANSVATLNRVSIESALKAQYASQTKDWDEFVKEVKESKKAIVHLDKLYTKTNHGGKTSPFDLGYTGGGSWYGIAKYSSGLAARGMAAAKMLEHFLMPYVDEAIAVKTAEYRSHTARSAAGFRQQELEERLAWLQRKHDVAMASQIILSGAAGAAAGAALGGEYGGAAGLIIGGALGGPAGALSLGVTGAKGGAVAGGVVGGIGGSILGMINSLWAHYKYKQEQEKAKEEMKQQEKTLATALKRSQAMHLFGPDYNMSYQEAIGNMGIGITEGDISAMSSNALTFRGRQAFGQVGIHEYTMLAQVPHYFQALEAGITDPEVLHKLLAADLSNIGDPSYAAYIASQLGGVGLGTYSALNNPSYYYATDSVNSRNLKGANIEASQVVEGYTWKNAVNSVLSAAASSAQNTIDAAAASDSFYNGPKPTKDKVKDAEQTFEDARKAVMNNDVAYTGNTYVIHVNVNGEETQTAQFKERDLIMSGQTYMVGGN